VNTMANNDIYRNADNNIDDVVDGRNNIGEIRRETWEIFKENFRESSEDARSWFGEYLGISAAVAFAPYIIPTLARISRENGRVKHEGASYAGIFTGLAGWFAQGFGYIYLVSETNPPEAAWAYLAIPVVTNLVDAFVCEPIAKTIRDVRVRRENRR
jgi:hypothetical protein